ncbi:FUSC family protein [Adhaeribacter swui]|uniref:FUSC family protein n=1 Tax=Adhaeribacter swui TaxID=2086471 RepID=A0A7G7GEI5_9BACT|nr:FUSC family protein [Adhaeribacter swui]QNF35569.1 FUSC family protein [Adhaeribacter swui]
MNWQQFLTFNSTKRPWHLPILAGLCVGIPLLVGYYTNHIEGGKLASLAGLVILYIQSNNLVNRMITLMTCGFGIMLSFSVGLLFSFHPMVAPLILSVFSFGVHFCLYQLRFTRPPGNFFFIMVAAMAISLPFNPDKIPERIGYVGMGTMISCVLGLLYSLFTLKKNQTDDITWTPKNQYVNTLESITFGVFVGLSLAIALLFKLDNPYWVPTSCVAVMQGVTTKHIWLRSSQRIVGTLLGLGVTWLIIFLKPPLLVICCSMVALQIIVEFLVVRNYAVAVVFITILTIFLAEFNSVLIADPNKLFLARFIDITIGSLVGAVGGWVLFNERIHYLATRQIRRTRLVLRKKHSPKF